MMKTRTMIHRGHVLMITSCCVAFLSMPTAKAEDDPPQRPDPMIAIKKFELKQDFAIHIAIIDEVCHLSEKQKQKLRIGSRGAIEKALDLWHQDSLETRNAALQRLRKLTAGSAFPITDEHAEEIKDADEIDRGFVRGMALETRHGPAYLYRPTENAFWLQTIESTLTAQQAELLQQSQQARFDELKKSQIKNTVMILTVELRLNQDQATGLEEIMESFINQKQTISGSLSLWMPALVTSQIDADKVKALLTPAQFQKFKLMKLPFVKSRFGGKEWTLPNNVMRAQVETTDSTNRNDTVQQENQNE